VRSEFKLEYHCDTPTQRRWFLCRVSRFSTDGAVRVLVAHLDITRAKEAENQRQRELLRWNSILKASSDGIHVIDADGLLLDANQAFLTMLGLDRSAIGTLRVTDWDVHADWAVIRERISMLIESDTPTTIETQHRCSDGRIIDVEISICCVRSEGQPFIYSASRDITARKQTEATLSRYQHHLEELVAERTLELKTLANQLLITEVRERSLLAAELHDDLGQNLALAKHKLGLFEEPGKNGASVDYLPAMKEVELLIDRANASVRSFSTQLSPLALTQFGLVAALESLAEDFLRVWGLSVRLHLCNTVTLHEPMAAILFRIVRELLINVLKHARVSEAELIMVLDADSGVLEITVADSGIGFDVKQKFTAGPASGYGLGSIRQRIGFMGGKMSIDSEVGNGTIVSLTLTPEPVRPQ
jgi:PAS domain S-box-containing protein